MHCSEGASKMNSMPAFGARPLRCIRPRARVEKSAATSAWIRCMPARSSVTGSDCASAAAAGSAISKARILGMNEKGRGSPCLFVDLEAGCLLLHFVFFGVFLGSGFLVALLHFAALRGVFLRCGFLVALGLLLGLFLVLHLRASVRRREGGNANRRKHRGNDHGQQLVHFSFSFSVRNAGKRYGPPYPERNNALGPGRLTAPIRNLPVVSHGAHSSQNREKFAWTMLTCCLYE